jgi:hypothetical protein
MHAYHASVNGKRNPDRLEQAKLDLIVWQTFLEQNGDISKVPKEFQDLLVGQSYESKVQPTEEETRNWQQYRAIQQASHVGSGPGNIFPGYLSKTETGTEEVIEGIVKYCAERNLQLDRKSIVGLFMMPLQERYDTLMGLGEDGERILNVTLGVESVDSLAASEVPLSSLSRPIKMHGNSRYRAVKVA